MEDSKVDLEREIEEEREKERVMLKGEFIQTLYMSSYFLLS